MTGKITDINPFWYNYGPKAELVKKQFGNLINIIANKDAFKELKQEKSLHYENVQIETANGLEINVDFTLNVYNW
jgi:lipid A disaccharide synthetase